MLVADPFPAAATHRMALWARVSNIKAARIHVGIEGGWLASAAEIVILVRDDHPVGLAVPARRRTSTRHPMNSSKRTHMTAKTARRRKRQKKESAGTAQPNLNRDSQQPSSENGHSDASATGTAAAVGESLSTGAAQHLARLPRGFFRRLFGTAWPNALTWGLSSGLPQQQVADRIKSAIREANVVSQPPRQPATATLSDAVSLGDELAQTLTVVAMAYRISKVARELSKHEQLEFENRLNTDLDLLNRPFEANPGERPLLRLLRDVEVPMALAMGLRRHALGHDLARGAIVRWSHLIREEVSELGFLPRSSLSDLAAWVASTARIGLMARCLSMGLPDDPQYRAEHCMLNALRLLRSDGTLLLGGGQLRAKPPLLAAISRFMTDRGERRFVREFGRAGRKVPSRKHMEPGTHCDQSGIGILKRDWKRNEATLVVTTDGPRCFVELAARQTLLSGDATPTWHVDHQRTAALPANCELNLHYVDADVEYLELEWKLEHGAIWQRQFALAREERFLVLADALLTPRAQSIDYECRFGLADGFAIQPESETREVYLSDGAIRASILPISMGEWQADGAPSGLEASSAALAVRHSNPASTLWSALVFDLDSSRCRKPRTWRWLTVGEQRNRVSRERALAMRFQLHREQFVVYRSLGPVANRSYLGANVFAEFALGRLKSDGRVEQLLLVE